MHLKPKFSLAAVMLLCASVHAQKLPREVGRYLDRNYIGWKLAPSKKGCGPDVNPGFVMGKFDNDRFSDYAVKFTRGDHGFIVAFLRRGRGFKPFVLHNYDADEATNSSIGVLRKGEVFENSETKLRVRHDAPYDYHCESDAGGIHYYRNGKFIGY